MQNELYLTMIYRPVVSGKRFVEKSSDVERLESRADRGRKHHAGTGRQRRGGAQGLRAVSPWHVRSRATAWCSPKRWSSSATCSTGSTSRCRCSMPPSQLPAGQSASGSPAKTGDFVITTPNGVNHFGAILNIKEYTDGTYPGILNGLKYLDFEYVITHSFSPMGRQDALKVLDRTKGMMISSGDKAVSQIAELDHAMDQLASGNFVLGEYHFTMAVYAPSPGSAVPTASRRRARSCRTPASSRPRKTWPSPPRSTRSSRATGSTARAWPTSAR